MKRAVETSSEQPLIAKGELAQESWPVVQPPMPRKPQYFLCGNLCGCCPPYILLALVLGGLAALLGFPGLSIFFMIVFSFLVVCGCPLASFYIFTRLWACPPWNWTAGLYVKLTYLAFQSVLIGRPTPTADKDMPVNKMKPKAVLAKNTIEYALNISVPKGSEEEFSNDSLVNGQIVQFLEESLSNLPQFESFEEFAEGEDPVEYIMTQLGSVFPEVYQVWTDKQSDKALTRFCLQGIGAHRIEIEEYCGRKMYVVKTNSALAGLPVREGFEHYGGDAYFDMRWNPVAIIDNGLHPAEPDGTPNPVVTQPGELGWDRAKFRFRSSLSVLVTVVDHLYGIHLQTANLFTTALREQLSPDHPMRRFFTPFTYQTISVNDNARNNLVQMRSIAPRCFGFTDQGMQLAFSAAPSLLKTGLEVSAEEGGPIFDRVKYIEYLKKQGIDTEYYRQSAELAIIMKKFIRSYMEYYYPTMEEALADPELAAFFGQFMHQVEFVKPTALTHSTSKEEEMKRALFNDLAPAAGAGLSCIAGGGQSPQANDKKPARDARATYELYLDIFTQFMFLVTAGHEQVGAVEAYVQDAAFCAFKWTPGSLVGTKQTATCQGLLMSFTSTPMPKLLGENWTHLFPSPTKPPKPGVKTASQVFTTFQEELAAMSKKCQEYNDTASSRAFPDNVPMYVLDPARLETSISV